MVDPPILDAVLTAIFKSDKYILGSGLTSCGDFNMPGSVEYQHLHRDMGNFFGDTGDASQWLDTPAPVVQVNFPLELKLDSTIGHTAHNGVTRPYWHPFHTHILCCYCTTLIIHIHVHLLCN